MPSPPSSLLASGLSQTNGVVHSFEPVRKFYACLKRKFIFAFHLRDEIFHLDQEALQAKYKHS